MTAFTPQLLAEMRTSIQQRTDHLIDDMERAGTCDFVSQFAYPLPSLVIFDLLGVPVRWRELSWLRLGVLMAPVHLTPEYVAWASAATQATVGILY
jgi:cytochrome P450